MNDLLTQNQTSWNAMAELAFGWTHLPDYGVRCPTENDLRLFPSLADAKVLDIGCGSGHSLQWCGGQGAGELWGLDISEQQLESAQNYLGENGYAPKLFCSPMEENPGLPAGYFDVVYSVYAIGWTVDLPKTFGLISSYLKPGGVFIFSWEHPLLRRVEARAGELVFTGNYTRPELFRFEKQGNPLAFTLYRTADYINALAGAGLSVVRMAEESDSATLSRDWDFSEDLYSAYKASRFPFSFVMKAVKT